MFLDAAFFYLLRRHVLDPDSASSWYRRSGVGVWSKSGHLKVNAVRYGAPHALLLSVGRGLQLNADTLGGPKQRRTLFFRGRLFLFAAPKRIRCAVSILCPGGALKHIW